MCFTIGVLIGERFYNNDSIIESACEPSPNWLDLEKLEKLEKLRVQIPAVTLLDTTENRFDERRSPYLARGGTMWRYFVHLAAGGSSRPISREKTGKERRK